MKIYLVRHAIAEERSPHVTDEDRALTKKGKRRGRRAFRGFAKIADPLRIVSSPLVRARQTAKLLARALGHEGWEEDDDLAPGGDRQALLSRLEGSNDVALVGHEPDLSLLAEVLAGRIELAKAGAALIEGEPRPGGAHLVWLLTPLQLARLAR